MTKQASLVIGNKFLHWGSYEKLKVHTEISKLSLVPSWCCPRYVVPCALFIILHLHLLMPHLLWRIIYRYKRQVNTACQCNDSRIYNQYCCCKMEICLQKGNHFVFFLTWTVSALLPHRQTCFCLDGVFSSNLMMPSLWKWESILLGLHTASSLPRRILWYPSEVFTFIAYSSRSAQVVFCLHTASSLPRDRKSVV